MKALSVSILLLALLAQSFSRFLVVLQYNLNREYIAKNLCENRNKPKCCCHGKCFLKKQLAKNDKEENAPNSNSKKDGTEVLFFAQERKYPNIHFIAYTGNKYFIYDSCFTPHAHYDALFRPPQV